MGQLLCCCYGIQTKEEYPERTPLLRDNRNSLSSEVNGNIIPVVVCRDPESMHELADNEELNKSLNKIVDNMIDITAVNKTIGKMEWKRREVLYTKRMALINKPLTLMSTYLRRNRPTVDVPRDDIQIKGLAEEDVKLIEYFSRKASEAVREGFKVHTKDSPVVPFDP